MGIITSVVLGLTLVGMFFGALFGLIRGRERALLRLVLVILSAVLAICCRGAIVDTVLNLQIEGSTVSDMIMGIFQEGNIPQGIQNLIISLVEILIGIVAYLILLLVFRFLTWFVAFPVLKLLIRFVENCRAKKQLAENASESIFIGDDTSAPDENAAQASENAKTDETELETNEESEQAFPEVTILEDTNEEPAKVVKLTRKDRKALVEKHRATGALVGLAQGVLLAYFLFAPLTGLLAQVGQLTSIKLNGNNLINLPEEIDIVEYTESGIGKFYISTGTWYYNLLSSATDASGNTVSIDDTVKLATTIMEVADIATSLESDFKILQSEDATPEEKISTLNNLGDKLISVGDAMNELGDDTLNMIKDLAVEMGGEDVSQEDIDKVLESVSPEFFAQAGNGIKAFAEYEQIKLGEEAVTTEQASDIVNKAYGCISLVESADVTLNINEQDKSEFQSAIDAMADISEEDKNSLYNLFGIQTSSEE